MDTTKPGSRRELTAVDGIGDKVADRLAQHGIETFGQLAGATDAGLAACLDGLRGGFTEQRIAVGRWRAQARRLAGPAGPASRATSSHERPVPPSRHNFTVEVTVDVERGAVVAAQVDHVQSGDRRAWVGWDPDAVLAFLTERITGTGGLGDPRRMATEPVGRGDRADRVSEATRVLHAYAVVPEPAERCAWRGAVRARITFSPRSLKLDPAGTSLARVRVFLRGRPGQKAYQLGATELTFGAHDDVQLVVPCDIPFDAIDPRLFALVEVHSDRDPSSGGAPLPVATLTGAELALLERA